MRDRRECCGVALSFGIVSVTEQVVAYQKKRVADHSVVDLLALDMPEQEFVTQALWYELPDELLREEFPLDVLQGSLHAAEHGQIAVLPLIAMCDRWDIGGLSTAFHRQTGRATIFIYDGHPGGVGITRVGFERFERLVDDALRLISECPCRDGCPSCVQSPKCGNLNEPLSKSGARRAAQPHGRALGAATATVGCTGGVRRHARRCERCDATSPDLPRPRRGARRDSSIGAACRGGARRGRGSFGGGASDGRARRQRRSGRRPGRSPSASGDAPRRRRRRPRRHRFPIAGAFDWGGSDARFGARRRGHRHQGQDLPAAAGTPVVAPYRGVVAAVQYQARGAGHYVVIHTRGLRLRVHAPAARLDASCARGSACAPASGSASVGSTGESTGPHLHFEVWVGGWFAGGDPIDPLPLLQEWSGVSPASG